MREGALRATRDLPSVASYLLSYRLTGHMLARMRSHLVRLVLVVALAVLLSPAVAAPGGERDSGVRTSADVRLVLPDMDRPARLTTQARAPRVLRTPGYRGGRRVPRTRPAAPPPPIRIGEGWKPSVTVDAAGTSHIVWTESMLGATPDVTHYCRMPRGARACDNPNRTPMPLADAYSGDHSGPKILRIGDQLVVLTHRYPPVVTHPDGQTDDETTYAWTSADGGTTWTGPAIVGNLPFNDVALVGGANPRIAAITSTYTPGLFSQIIDAGNYTRQRTLLAASASTLIYGGRVAADGDGIVAAASGPVGPVLVRRTGTTAGAPDPGAWSSTQVPGDEPHLAGGPSGPFLMTRTGQRPTLWRVDGAGVPQRLSTLTTKAAKPVALTQDDGGGVIASWVSGTPSVLETRRVGPNGTGGAAFPAAVGRIDEVASAAAFDGGGVMVYRRDSTGTSRGTIAVAPYGPLSPTGRPGAGSRAAEGIPGGYAGCRAVGFGKVAISPRAGCLLQSTDPAFRGAYVSRSAVDLNGLTLIPDAGVSIIVNPAKRTLDTTGRVTIALEGSAIGRIPLARMELHLKLSGANGTSLFSGVDLPRGASIKGFPIDADYDVIVAGDGIRIPLSLKLPPALGGVSGSVTIRATRGVGAQLDSFRLGAKTIPLGPVSIRDLSIAYTAEGNRWSGGGKLDFVTGALTLRTEFANGRFISGSFAVDLPTPGIMVFNQVWLTQVRGGLRLQPQFSASLGVSLGIIYTPSTKLYAADVRGDLTMTIRGGDLNFVAEGSVAVAGLGVGRGRTEVDTSGYAAMRSTAAIDLKVAQITGETGGFFDGRNRTWGLSSENSVRALGVTVSKVALAASPAGFGACGTASPPLPPLVSVSDGVQPAHLQVTYPWGGSARVSVGTSCSLDRYRPPAPAQTMERGVRRAHAEPGDRPVPVTGRRTMNIMVVGAGGAAPDVDVVDPAGAVVDPSARNVARYPVAQDSVLIVLQAPRTGTWAIRPRAGSPGIADLEVAAELSPVRVTGRLVGPARSRRLSYRVQAPAGTRIEFRETWRGGGRRVLAATARRSGTVRLPVDGRGGQRTVVAVAVRDGLPQQTFTLGRYRAPAPTRLAAPAGVVVAATAVRWRAVTGARRYIVIADLASGRRVAVQTAGNRRNVRIPGASRGNSVRRVRITAVDTRMRLGRTALAVPKPVRSRR